MARKFACIGIVIAGLVLAVGSNAWAGPGRFAKRHHHQHFCQSNHGHHHGWTRGKRHYHKPCRKHHRAYHYRDYRRPVVVEKHVYHYDQVEEPEPAAAEDGFRLAFSVADERFGVSVELSGSDQ